MVPIIIDCLRAVTHPRFFETERGYQGELLAELRARLPHVGLPGDAIIEQEYQKRLPAHGIAIRPDLIVHVPTLDGGDRQRGNFAAFELNLAAGPKEARGDFDSLDAMIEVLDYPLGVFVNIASARTQAASYSGRFGGRLHFFAVQLTEHGLIVRHAHHTEGGLVEEAL